MHITLTTAGASPTHGETRPKVVTLSQGPNQATMEAVCWRLAVTIEFIPLFLLLSLILLSSPHSSNSSTSKHA